MQGGAFRPVMSAVQGDSRWMGPSPQKLNRGYKNVSSKKSTKDKPSLPLGIKAGDKGNAEAPATDIVQGSEQLSATTPT